jgi:hypothetical protein
VIPVTIQASGTISKSLRKYLSKLSGRHESKELQKTAALATAHVLRKDLMQKYTTFNMANNIICGKNCNCRITAIL